MNRKTFLIRSAGAMMVALAPAEMITRPRMMRHNRVEKTVYTVTYREKTPKGIREVPGIYVPVYESEIQQSVREGVLESLLTPASGVRATRTMTLIGATLRDAEDRSFIISSDFSSPIFLAAMDTIHTQWMVTSPLQD